MCTQLIPINLDHKSPIQFVYAISNKHLLHYLQSKLYYIHGLEGIVQSWFFIAYSDECAFQQWFISKRFLLNNNFVTHFVLLSQNPWHFLMVSLHAIIIFYVIYSGNQFEFVWEKKNREFSFISFVFELNVCRRPFTLIFTYNIDGWQTEYFFDGIAIRNKWLFVCHSFCLATVIQVKRRNETQPTVF